MLINNEHCLNLYYQGKDFSYWKKVLEIFLPEKGTISLWPHLDSPP